MTKHPMFWTALVAFALFAFGCLDLLRSTYFPVQTDFYRMIVLLPTLVAGCLSLGLFVNAAQRSRRNA